MVMRQLYYTSCTKGTGAGSGFQVKALTPGMSQEERDALNRSLGYRIPPGLPSDAVEAHPVALRYQCLDASSCILLCSQSSGPDDAGRPGNFFAHCILTDRKDFAFFPPIMYWKHPFWRREDQSDRLEIESVASFDMEPSMEFGDVWTFLDSKGRREWFHSLLCAVLRFGEDRRPVVIIDSADNVAMWVAAVTFALPAGVRPYISFATYHHDPYQVPFLITGTTSDSRFRCSADEYESYFVMNVPQGKVSHVKPSEYASRVCAGMHESSYEEELVDFLAFCSDHIRASQADFGRQLDGAARLFSVLREDGGKLDDSVARQTIAGYLQQLEEGATQPTEVLRDLDAVGDQCCDALLSGGVREAGELYARVLRLLARHDPEFPTRRAGIMDLLAQLVAKEHEAGVAALSSIVADLNSNSDFSRLAVDAQFIEALTSGWPREGSKALDLTWRHVVPLIARNERPAVALASIVAATVQSLDRSSLGSAREGESARASRPESIVATVLRSVGGRAALEMGLAKGASTGGHDGFGSIYYELVRALTQQERHAYRVRLVGLNSDLSVAGLIGIEARRDFAVRSGDEFFQKLEESLDPGVLAPDLRRALIDAAVRQFWSSAEARETVPVAGRLLRAPWLSGHFSERTESALVLTRFRDTRLRALGAEDLELAERYLRHPALTSITTGGLQGQIAMTKGKFAPGTTGETRNWLASLNKEDYAREVAALIGRFFAKDVHVAGHLDMLRAAYLQDRQAEFWSAYWGAFRARALAPDGALPMVDLLSFWFDSSLSAFEEQPYMGAAFFLRLPEVLRSLADERSARAFFAELDARGAKLPWYELIRPAAKAGKPGLFSSFRR
jgi:hypothetical protein